MRLNGLAAHAELPGNFFCRLTIRNSADDLALAGGEHRARRPGNGAGEDVAVDDFVCRAGAEVALAGANGADGGDEFGGGGLFAEASCHARLKSLLENRPVDVD